MKDIIILCTVFYFSGQFLNCIEIEIMKEDNRIVGEHDLIAMICPTKLGVTTLLLNISL